MKPKHNAMFDRRPNFSRLNSTGTVFDEEKAQSCTNLNTVYQYDRTLDLKHDQVNPSLTIAVLLPNSSQAPYWKLPLDVIDQILNEGEYEGLAVKKFFFDLYNSTSFIEVCSNLLSDNTIQGVVFPPIYQEESKQFCNELKNRGLSYAFIDNKLDDMEELCFIGQNSFQGGRVAAQLLSNVCASEGEILIVTFWNENLFNRHVKLRIEGFKSYIKSLKNKTLSFKELVIKQTDEVLINIELANHINAKTQAIFISNSHGAPVASMLKMYNIRNCWVATFDLTSDNKFWMREGFIHYIINQSPEEQVYMAIEAICNSIITRKTYNYQYFLPINIITSECID
jgi:LacI family transcriptional regulator